jgi:hypothetical protein
VNAMANTTVCEICGEPMPPGEEMFKFHGYSAPCPKPPKATNSGRTIYDALNEAEHLLKDTFVSLDPENDRDCWFMARLNKIREALADRPAIAGR